MLIEFRVSNYRSIGEEQVLSLVPATNQKEYPDNIFIDSKNQALNVAAIYGANGSGKSNLLSAFKLFSNIVNGSAQSSSTATLLFDPFLLREGWNEKPTRFEIAFSIRGDRYRYGFEYNEKEIIEEWLFRKGIGREVNLFFRKQDVVDASSGFRGNLKLINAAIEATRANALFLSMCDMLNIEEATSIFLWLSKMLHVDGSESDYFGSWEIWEDEFLRDEINGHLLRLKLGPIGVDIKKEERNKEGPGLKVLSYHISAAHKFYNKIGQATEKVFVWDYMNRESTGSVKALQMAGSIVLALNMGGIIVIDELEAKMHPLLTLDTINLFLNKETNPNNAQLIFATHDTNLLSYSNLRRDQIYFAEKNNWESTEIYSLSDFVYVDKENGKESKERPDTDKEKRYIEGRYGAIPVLGSFSKLAIKKNG
jgi:AAA15 family ATPase/GTPase